MRAPRGWLISPAVDLGLMMGPALVASVAALILPQTASVGLLSWVLLVVCVDVAHVYAALYRTYLDPAERARHPRRYVLVPVLALLAGLAAYAASPAAFWTPLAYLAVWHFMRQQVGFLSLYRLAEGQSTRSPDARLERAALTSVMLWPLLWWHAHLPRPFDWFVQGDFIVGLPAWAPVPVGLASALLVIAHGVARLRSGVWAPGRDLWFLSTAAVWVGGIVLADSDLGFTATNVLMHGLPYLALVAWTGRQQWAQGAGPVAPSWFRSGGLLVALGLLLVLAFLEEGLWDALVWQEHPQLFGAWAAPDLLWLAVPLLSVPQITHYVLDGLIWRMGGQNPGLRQALFGPTQVAQGPDATAPDPAGSPAPSPRAAPRSG